MGDADDNEDEWSVDSIDPAPRTDGKPGPPDDWIYPSWFDRSEIDWYWQGKPDPCPVRPLGFNDGLYIFVTAACEIRRFSAGQLHGRGGLSDLFGGSYWWPLKHFRKYNVEKKELSGPLQRERCINALMRACLLKGFHDDSKPLRGVGTWRGPDGTPLVHAGSRIFLGQFIEFPGVELGDALYVIGADRKAPAHLLDKYGGFSWEPCGPEIGRRVVGTLDEWHWEDPEARDLYAGGLFCDMLGEAPIWRPHKFVRAPFSSGKSKLLEFTAALLGGAAHPIQRTYSRAFLEQQFSGTSLALLLDETESDTEASRVRNLMELVRLLSDDRGAIGGRGTASGKARRFDLHGTVTMVATVTETWRPQDRSRIVLLELRPLGNRQGHPILDQQVLQDRIEWAREVSPAIRARAISKWALFLQNVKGARACVLSLGGNTRDADQLGHLIAGWWTMTSDDPLNEGDIEQLPRFRRYIMSLTELEDGDDEASECLNTLLGLTPHNRWMGGKQLTIGQLIAQARQPEGSECRESLLANGLRLHKSDDEGWELAWLCIANKHPGLDRLLVDYPQWRGNKRRQVLAELRKPLPNGDVLEVKRWPDPLWIGGTKTRCLLIPPQFLPEMEDE